MHGMVSQVQRRLAQVWSLLAHLLSGDLLQNQTRLDRQEIAKATGPYQCAFLVV